MATYSFIVYPCNGPNLWPPLQTPAMLPLVMRRALGRPKKARNKRNDKPRNSFKLPRQSKSIVCKKCGKIGHNKGHVKERQLQIGTFQNGVIR